MQRKITSGRIYDTDLNTAVGVVSSSATIANDITLCNALGSAIVMTLPLASDTLLGVLLAIKKTDSSANAVTVAPQGANTIDGKASWVLAKQHDMVQMRCDGSKWQVTSYIGGSDRGEFTSVTTGTMAATGAVSGATGAFPVLTAITQATVKDLIVTPSDIGSDVGGKIVLEGTGVFSDWDMQTEGDEVRFRYAGVDKFTIDPDGNVMLNSSAKFEADVLKLNNKSVFSATSASNAVKLNEAGLCTNGTQIGGLRTFVNSITGNTTLTGISDTILANATSGAITVTLPVSDANITGKIITVKKTDSSSNIVTVLPQGADAIDGTANWLLYKQHDTVLLGADGDVWRVLGYIGKPNRGEFTSVTTGTMAATGAVSGATGAFPVLTATTQATVKDLIVTPSDIGSDVGGKIVLEGTGVFSDWDVQTEGDEIQFRYNGVEKFTIDPDGNVMLNSSAKFEADVLKLNTKSVLSATTVSNAVKLNEAGQCTNGTQIGGLRTFVNSITGNTTLTGISDTILANATSGAITVTLPVSDANITGKIITVKKTDSSSNIVTVLPQGADAIDGEANIELTKQYDYVVLQADGDKWIVMSVSTSDGGTFDLDTALDAANVLDRTITLSALTNITDTAYIIKEMSSTMMVKYLLLTATAADAYFGIKPDTNNVAELGLSIGGSGQKQSLMTPCVMSLDTPVFTLSNGSVSGIIETDYNAFCFPNEADITVSLGQAPDVLSDPDGVGAGWGMTLTTTITDRLIWYFSERSMTKLVAKYYLYQSAMSYSYPARIYIDVLGTDDVWVNILSDAQGDGAKTVNNSVAYSGTIKGLRVRNKRDSGDGNATTTLYFMDIV